MDLDRQPAPPPGPTRNHTRGIRPTAALAVAAVAYVAGRWGIDDAAGTAAIAMVAAVPLRMAQIAHQAGEAPWQRWRAC